MNIESYKELAESKHAEHKKFLQWLRKKKPKDLDGNAQESTAEAYEEIDCLKCANCCKSTGPLFTDRDITRISKYLRLKPKVFIDTYLRLDEENDYVLQNVPCTFLDNDNHCLIYSVRPKACAEFPHTDRRKLYQINSLTIKNTKICPIAYEVVEKLKESYQP